MHISFLDAQKLTNLKITVRAGDGVCQSMGAKDMSELLPTLAVFLLPLGVPFND